MSREDEVSDDAVDQYVEDNLDSILRVLKDSDDTNYRATALAFLSEYSGVDLSQLEEDIEEYDE